MLLAIEKWDRLDILVFDVFHTAYDWSTAHHEVDLPVVLVDCGKRYSSVKVAGPEFRKQVNVAVAREHDLNGWDVRPPYFADQSRTRTQVPTYENPRHLITMMPGGGFSRLEWDPDTQSAKPVIGILQP